MNINFPDICKKYVNLQCNDNLADYIDCPELSALDLFFSEKNPKNIIELGCGLGRCSVWLKNKYSWHDTNFYLLDGNSGEEQKAGINYDIGNNFYNSMEATKDFCLANGISAKNLFLVNIEDKINVSTKFDLCYSVKAVGFHWPIMYYLEFLKNKMMHDSYLLFELRNPSMYLTREKRIEKFVSYQINTIDSTFYKILAFDKQKKFPILILQRTDND